MVIRAASECMNQAFAAKSYVFRFGGDEFVVISTIKKDEFESLIVKFNKLLEEANKGRNRKISISIGTAYALSENDIDFEDLMNRADEEMYLNKKMYYETNHIERRHV